MLLKKIGLLLPGLVAFLLISNIKYIQARPNANQDVEKPAYLKSDNPIDVRVEDLLKRMTLQEKVGQMNIPCVYKKRIGWGIEVGEISIHTKMTLEQRKIQMDGCKKFAEGIHNNVIGPGGGFFTLSDRIVYEGTRRQAEFLNELQKIAVEKTRLKIPVLQIEEGTHGLMCSGGTIFPEGLALGSTWNLDLIKRIYSASAKEARAIGVHVLCTLVIEPNRDPRMGRNEEGYSEDPYLCSLIAESIVEGAQDNDVSKNDKVVAALCHYPGQSEPLSGLERGAMHISERSLREVFLPPWVAGIKKKGALAVMATYPALDGIAVHSSENILKKILREELGFDGIVLSEGRGISTIIDERIVDSQKKAGQVAVKAGVDVGISFEDAYLGPLIESVREGKVAMSDIDQAVRHILKLKFRLGLFENPYVDVERAVSIVHTDEHQMLALQAAREGIVLLKNENHLLPLKRDIRSIAVIGPNADADIDQLGDYSPLNILHDIVSVVDGIKSKVSGSTEITYVRGCNVRGDELDEVGKARQAAKNAGVAIVVVGESRQTNGEGRDVADLDLSGLQKDLIKAVYETGTPTIVVLINGRPLSIRWTAEHVPAVIEAWNCGELGGNAVADVLFGDYNPSGKIPVTIPRHVGQLPVYYNAHSSKSVRNYVNMSAEPLFEFGFGLSYTKFEYSNLRISSPAIAPAGEIRISADIKNIGDREGKEIVQLYINDVLSSVSTPLIELQGFEKLLLKPGEQKTVTFTLTPEHLSLLDRNMKWTVEPGEFEIMVGASSKDIRLRGKFEVVN